MGKRQRKLKPLIDVEDSEEEVKKSRTRIEEVSSDDGAAANEDLTVKIVEKSMRMRSRLGNDDVSFVVKDLKEEERKGKKKRKKSKEVEIEVPLDPSDDFEDGKRQEIDKSIEISSNAFESNHVENSNNVVLRKLLRGPRYFDPPDNSWGACYNCGEEGHTTINCPSEKRRRPCYVCGSYEHIGKLCDQGRDCFICQQKGHRAKDCPDKSKSAKMCLKCGDFGHTMFSCRNGYSSDDLKEIKCYICARSGHICCVDYTDSGPTEVSCYHCGLSGHTGLACTSHETATGTNDNSCYKCGVHGHFARECTSSKKAGKRNSEQSSTPKPSKRNREPSTPKQKSSRKKGDRPDTKSAPDKTLKKKSQFQDFASAGQTKHRGGWVSERPGDSYSSKTKRFKETPHYDRRSNLSTPNGHYALSTPRSSRNYYQPEFNYSDYYGSSGFHQFEFSDPRFVRKGHHWRGRTYDQW